MTAPRASGVPPLHPQRAVAIVAIGGYEPDPARLRRTRAYFEARGLRVVYHLDPTARHLRFAGTDAERAGWLADAIADPDVNLVVVERGGYGATRLLPTLPFDAMAAAVTGGKRFVGHSDFTAVSLGLLARTGAISFAGPMASFGFGAEAIDPFTESHFWQAIDDALVDVAFPTPCRETMTVEGTLWGGNLAMLTSLVGTPWMPRIDGGILFIEDVNEHPYRVERMLLQLQQAGILDRQRLVLCGDFTAYRTTDYDNGYDLPDVLDHLRGVTKTPIVQGLPFGHVPRKLTLAVGARATVTIDDGACHLRQQLAVATVTSAATVPGRVKAQG